MSNELEIQDVNVNEWNYLILHDVLSHQEGSGNPNQYENPLLEVEGVKID